MSAKLVLHIGSHKTGTTSIQQAFATHRGVLEEHGVHYSAAFGDRPHSVPIVRMFMHCPGDYLHVARSGLSDAALETAISADRQALLEEIDAVGDGTLLISGEDIGDLRGADLEALASFCREHFESIEIVYVVRDPQALVRSIEHQLLRSGEGRAERFRPITIAGRYDAVPQRFAEVFGHDRVTVARFEDLVVTDVVNEFARRFLGVDDARLVGRVHNEGLSRNAVRMLRLWNRFVPRERPGFVTQRVARPLRGLLVRFPGRADRTPPAIDAAAAQRIDLALSQLVDDFGIEAYPSLSARFTR